MKTAKKLKVGVIFGGSSSEKEISLESGRHIYNSLNSDRYQIIPIFLDSKLKLWLIEEELIWMNTTKDIENALKSKAHFLRYELLGKKIDFAFLGLHGTYVEDGAFQGLLSILEIPFNGSGILGSAIGMDKVFQKAVLKANGLKIADYIIVEKSDYTKSIARIRKQVAEKLGYPCIVKPAREGCSTGVSKVNNENELAGAIKIALKYGNKVLVEKFMNMMEVTCTVLGNENPYALLPTQTPAKSDFLTVEEKFLPGDAEMITPPRVDKEDVEKMQSEFVRAYRALNLSVYARIDAFWDQKSKLLYINEPNTLPGVTPSTHVFQQAAEAGMTPADFFNKVIQLSLEKFHN